jgi:ABC-type transporter Mla MlaB component
MEFTKTENNTWVLRGNLTFENISKVIDKAKDFNWEHSVNLDLSGVGDVDTSLLALIFHWKRLAKVNKKSVFIFAVPENLMKLARLYGAEEFISSKN